MKVIGTAGHVDHGKSTLVEALTGIDPDRLREEKEREMTIDLGFAWITTPAGETASIVDMPGHEDFIRNMLAGVGGIDIALFVIAADEGVMPQTREHLAILDLLDIHDGVIALTKAELVDEPDWLELVREEVAEELSGTSLDGAPIIPVSAVTGAGLPDLVRVMEQLLSRTGPKPDLGRPRLGIDRTFTISGFGTVVTGTLLDGSLEVGQEVEILPVGRRARVRGLQTHKRKIEKAVPGSRVAVNLVGPSVEDLRRGDVLTTPGWLHPTTLVDADLRLVPSIPKPLEHGELVDFFIGTAQTQATVRLLDREELEAGGKAWVQLRLSKAVAVTRDDRFILRQPSPSATIGGGRILSHHPGQQYRRFRPEVMRHLETLASQSPAEIVSHLLQQHNVVTIKQLSERSGIPENGIVPVLKKLVDEGDAFVLTSPEAQAVALNAQTILSSRAGWKRVADRLSSLLGTYHRSYPLRMGMPREELRTKLRLPSRQFAAVVSRAAEGDLVRLTNATVSLPKHQITFTPAQQESIDELLGRFGRQLFTPPSVGEAEATVGPDVLAAMIERGDLVKISDSVLLSPEAYRKMRGNVVERLRDNGSITVGQVRDMFGTSRKYALALLEHLDERRITRRTGDERVLR